MWTVPKNAGQFFTVVGLFLKRDEVTIELIETVVTFDKEFLDNFVKWFHGGLRKWLDDRVVWLLPIK